MECHKISKSLNDSTISKFVTKWIEVNDLSGGQYPADKNIRFKTPMLRSDLCDYSSEYIVVKGIITIEGANAVKRRNKNQTFKNIAPFRTSVSKINNTFIDSAEGLDMLMYNLLEYSENYSMKSGSLWNFYRDKVNDYATEIAANRRLNNNKTTTSKSFEYKTKMIGRTPAHSKRVNTLKY